MKEVLSTSPAATVELGKKISGKIKPGAVIGFEGELGTGKTFLIKALCKEFSVEETVNSPTFSLMQFYSGSEKIMHMDCYRLNSIDEALELGLEEYFESDYICFIEWAEKIKEILPEHTESINMYHVPGQSESRRIIFNGQWQF